MFPDPIPLKLNLDFRVLDDAKDRIKNLDPLIPQKIELTKILVIDDLIAMRNHMLNLLAKILPGELDLDVASNGSEALSLVLAKRPDLVILDVLVGDSNGFKIAEKIWMNRPQTRILFWARTHKEKHIFELERIKPGCTAYGYILKSEADEKITYAIESILLHDNPYIHPSYRLSNMGSRGPLVELSEAELQTLHDVAIGLTDRAIARRRHISVRGVQNRISVLLTKVLKGECGIINSIIEVELINQRSRLVFEALCRGLIDIDDIESWSQEYFSWLHTQMESSA